MVHITNHAFIRFKQRNRLALTYTNYPRAVMEDLITSGIRDIRLDLYPFYKNKMGITKRVVNGVHCFYFVGDNVVTYVRKNLLTEDWRY